MGLASPSGVVYTATSHLTTAPPPPAPSSSKGAFTIGQGSTINSTGDLETAGTTTIDGTLDVANLEIIGGTLEGIGTINGNVQNGATVEPGDAPGTLTINGNYTQDSVGILNIDLGGYPSPFRQLAISGTASLDGTLNVNLVSGYSPVFGNNFTILTFTSHTGTFATVNGLSNAGGPLFKLYYNTGNVMLDAATSTIFVSQKWTLVSPPTGGSEDGTTVSGTEFGGTIDAIYGETGFGIITGYSAPSESDMPTIQDAINAAAPGTIIDVAAGNYPENLNINEVLELIGPNGNVNPVTEPAGRAAEAIIDPASGAAISITAPTSTSTVSITGFTIEAVTGIDPSAVPVDIENDIIMGTGPASTGIDLSGAASATVTGNVISNVGIGINSTGSGGSGAVTIQGNSITTAGDGIDLDSVAGQSRLAAPAPARATPLTWGPLVMVFLSPAMLRLPSRATAFLASAPAATGSMLTVCPTPS